MARHGTLHDWVGALPGRGRYAFSRAETRESTGASEAAIKMTLNRLKKTGAIVSPRRDFFVVVPPEYRSAGSPPASWFIDDLMAHLSRRYYVALLTAAAIHGAGHQQPMAFQVMVGAPERDIQVGRVRIEFHVSRRMAQAVTERAQTQTGSMTVSTPETTAFDLVHLPAACGSWSNVATVLSELAEKLDGASLAGVARRASISDTQRLGWLLDRVGQSDLADVLARHLADRRLLTTPLTPARATGGATVDTRWRVLVNDEVEPDL